MARVSRLPSFIPRCIALTKKALILAACTQVCTPPTTAAIPMISRKTLGSPLRSHTIQKTYGRSRTIISRLLSSRFHGTNRYDQRQSRADGYRRRSSCHRCLSCAARRRTWMQGQQAINQGHLHRHDHRGEGEEILAERISNNQDSQRGQESRCVPALH